MYKRQMQMCRTGKINGVNYQDSLFRGIEVDGDSVDSVSYTHLDVYKRQDNRFNMGGCFMSKITDYAFLFQKSFGTSGVNAIGSFQLSQLNSSSVPVSYTHLAVIQQVITT